MAKMPNSEASTSAPATPPANPTITLLVNCAAITDVIAATSIIPSMPRLIMPPRWTTSSPSTARRSGIEATSASGTASASSSNTFEDDQHENDHGLRERRHARGDVRGALQLARAGDE